MRACFFKTANGNPLKHNFSGKTFPELNRQRFSSQIESYEERRGVPPSDHTAGRAVRLRAWSPLAGVAFAAAVCPTRTHRGGCSFRETERRWGWASSRAASAAARAGELPTCACLLQCGQRRLWLGQRRRPACLTVQGTACARSAVCGVLVLACYALYRHYRSTHCPGDAGTRPATRLGMSGGVVELGRGIPKV
jgi:hypothetical protein